MNLLYVILLLVTLQGAYSSVKNSPCYHSCACPNSIPLEATRVCICPYDCNLNQVPILNQLQVVDSGEDLHKPEPRHLVSWAAQLCGIAVLIALQLATSE